jgi:hypothetical protein
VLEKNKVHQLVDLAGVGENYMGGQSRLSFVPQLIFD